MELCFFNGAEFGVIQRLVACDPCVVDDDIDLEGAAPWMGEMILGGGEDMGCCSSRVSEVGLDWDGDNIVLGGEL